LPLQQQGQRRCRTGGKRAWCRQAGQFDLTDGSSSVGNAGIQIGHFGGRHQTEMALRQLEFQIARQATQKIDAERHALTQHFFVAGTGDTVCQHTAQIQAGPVMLEAIGDCTHGLGHAGHIHHRRHRQLEQFGQIGAARLAIKQAHDAFEQQQVGATGSFIDQLAALRRAHHPQIELIYRIAAGACQYGRIEKIRTALEHPHAQALLAVPARQRGGHRGLAVIRSRRADQQGRTNRLLRRRTGWLVQKSTPRCALMPCSL
jgi:hypothetical protein